MSEINDRLNEKQLDQVVGGLGRGDDDYDVIDIGPYWVRVTVNDLKCRYWPNGEIAKSYDAGHELKIDGVTTDGNWYRLWIYDPRGGECYGYIWKDYTETI